MHPKGAGIHHYHSTLYALDGKSTLNPGAIKNKLLTAMKGKIIAQTELVVVYERK
ncbi:MAG: hypothetical protein K2X90_01455 [Candidatus Babeliaceae bacterium]|nr:hypothetical protein [Candidatus Babeliaceae bacterium]